MHAQLRRKRKSRDCQRHSATSTIRATVWKHGQGLIAKVICQLQESYNAPAQLVSHRSLADLARAYFLYRLRGEGAAQLNLLANVMAAHNLEQALAHVIVPKGMMFSAMHHQPSATTRLPKLSTARSLFADPCVQATQQTRFPASWPYRFDIALKS